MEEKFVNEKAFHLAGIIPVAGQPLDFDLPWHDSCMPVAQNYLAVERAAIECAYAGCETIWVVCHDDMQPLIRHRMGDYVQDPNWVQNPHVWYNPEDYRKEIPIFYVPVHPKDREKRDCLSWSILHGANVAYNTSGQMSKWLTPDRYYVSFPYGVYPPMAVKKHRSSISRDDGFFISYDGKTIKDGEYLGFTFNSKDYFKFLTTIKTDLLKRSPILDPKKDFSLDLVFQEANLENSDIIEVNWYYNVDSWENYCQYIASEESKKIHRPHESIFTYKEWNPVGVDN